MEDGRSLSFKRLGPLPTFERARHHYAVEQLIVWGILPCVVKFGSICLTSLYVFVNFMLACFPARFFVVAAFFLLVLLSLAGARETFGIVVFCFS